MSNIVQHLIDSVAQAWGFDIIPIDRTRDAIGARLCCMVKLRSMGFSLHAIARQMHLDHTTVLYWINKIPDDLAREIRDWDPSSLEGTLELIPQVNAFLGAKEVNNEQDNNTTTAVV